MAKKLKRAFTIVELVIVIAVIAILAAVLIPTFTSLIDKANQSADTSNVKNMNSILAMDETTNGKPKTMYDAVKVIREGGYDLEKLTPTGQGYDIVWDQDANRLLMVNGEEVIFGETEKNANEKHLWVVVDSQEEIEATKYSVYLTDAFAGEVTAAQGVDVGANEDVTKVTYNTAEKQDVTIRTNGGALEVSAAAATVSHYGTAASVDIQAVANESYHEYGTVNQIDVTVGRVVLESGAATKTVYVKGEGVKVEWKEDSKPVEVGISTEVDDTKVQLPSGSDVPVKDVDEAVSSLFAGGLGTAGSPYQIATAEQFKNIDQLSANMKAGTEYYFELRADLTLDNSLYENMGDYYIIEQFRGNFEGLGHSITVPNNTGNSSTWFGGIAYLPGDAVFKNINIVLPENGRFSLVGNYFNDQKGQTSGNVSFINIDTYNSGVESPLYNNNGLLLINSFRKTLEFKDCDNYAFLNGQGNTSGGIWIGQFGFDLNGDNTVTFENCVNHANIIGEAASMFMSNTSYMKINNANLSYPVSLENRLTIKNCFNKGMILGTKTATLFGTGSDNTNNELLNTSRWADKVNSDGAVCSVVKMVENGISVNEEKKLEINNFGANVNKYILSYVVEVGYSEAGIGGHTRRQLSFEVEKGILDFYDAKMIDTITFAEKFPTVEAGEILTDMYGTEYWIYNDVSTGDIYYVFDAGSDGANKYQIKENMQKISVFGYSGNILVEFATIS